MKISVRSYAKINLGLRIGRLREDGFHDLHTVYQTIALHDRVSVKASPGSGITITSSNPAVPTDSSNTCYRMAERALDVVKKRVHLEIHIEKRLPLQGGLGAASANAVAALLGIERVLKTSIPMPEKLLLAAEVGSDVPLFLVGGTILGVGRGEQVYALEDLPAMPCVVVTPEVGVSTPQAFRDWDFIRAQDRAGQLTSSAGSHTMNMHGHAESAWLWAKASYSGVSARSRNRAETPLLDLVRAGIENDFEYVVFPKHPELRKVKSVLVEHGASYAALSGSGSSLFGLFASKSKAEAAARKLQKQGLAAHATHTLTRRQYWAGMFR